MFFKDFFSYLVPILSVYVAAVAFMFLSCIAVIETRRLLENRIKILVSVAIVAGLSLGALVVQAVFLGTEIIQRNYQIDCRK